MATESATIQLRRTWRPRNVRMPRMQLRPPKPPSGPRLQKCQLLHRRTAGFEGLCLDEAAKQPTILRFLRSKGNPSPKPIPVSQALGPCSARRLVSTHITHPMDTCASILLPKNIILSNTLEPKPWRGAIPCAGLLGKSVVSGCTRPQRTFPATLTASPRQHFLLADPQIACIARGRMREILNPKPACPASNAGTYAPNGGSVAT